MSDWWSKKLSNPNPSQRSSTAPYPSNLPTSVRLRFPETQQQPVSPERITHETLSPNTEIKMGDAIRMFKGGEAMKKEGDARCPDCGSQHVFSRVSRNANTTIQGKAPAPRCFECGWTGMYTQAVEGNWAT
jgi:DNA-directed RNA polymerase subunit RPC12/RpoP